MLKIMIVDDVPIFLDYLEDCIDWKNYGFVICGKAHDGVEALAQMEELMPDIVLTDITMPYMDGLTFAEKLAQHYPNVSTILITGNSEFEYARKAVKLGVCDYIVKPFEREELLLSLLKQKDNINRALEAQNRQAALEAENQDNVLRKLILGRHQNWSNHMDTLIRAGLSFTSHYFMVCTMKTPQEQLYDMEQLHDWEEIMMDLLKSRIELSGSFYIFKDYENNIVILMNFISEEEMKNYKAYELSDFKKIIKRQLDIDFTLGISDFCYSLEDIKTGYLQSIAITDKEQPSGILYSWEMISKLTQGLEELNSSLIKTTLEEEFRHYRELDNVNNHDAMLTGLISILLTHVIKSGRAIESIFGSDFSPYDRVKSLTSIDEGERYITDLYLTVVTQRKKNAETKSFQVVEQVKAYIHENYSDSDLCVADISKATLINQTYLRSMFKEETSLTITEYITKFRMNEAARLLTETNEKIAIIAERVGYSDESYFSKSFKKYFGVTPKNYVQ